MRLKNILCSGLCLLLSWTIALGQKNIVAVNLGGRAFKSDVPFDEPFHILIPENDNISKVELIYRISLDARKNWHYFPPEDARGPCGWTLDTIQALNLGGEMMLANVGPLHPNVPYEFQFSVFTKIVLSDAEKEALRKKLSADLKVVLTKHENIQPADLTRLKSTLNQDLLDAANSRLPIVNSSGERFVINAFSSELDAVSMTILRSTSLIEDLKGDYTVDVEAVIEDFSSPWPSAQEVANRMLEILNNEIMLSPLAKPQFENDLNPSLTGFSTLSAKDVMRMIVPALNNPEILSDLLLGKAKFEDDKIKVASGPDPSTLRLLINFFSAINYPEFRTADNAPIFDDNYRALFKSILRKLKGLLNSVETIVQQRAALEDLHNSVPNVLENKLLRQEIDVFDETTVVVEKEKNDYVGLGVGLGYAPDVQSFFTCQFANIYFRPVNKKVPISHLTGMDRQLKTFSLFLGIAQVLGDNADEQYKALMGDNNTPIVGLGYRFNRLLVLNAGGLLFSQKHENPVITKTDFAVTPTITLSLDINLADGLGAVGKLFNLIK